MAVVLGQVDEVQVTNADGTTSTVILAAEMLQNAWQLILQGIHPSTIARGFRKSEQFVLNSLEEISLQANEDMQKTVVETSLAGKGHSSMQETIADISLRAVKMIVDGESIDPTKIKLISQTGGPVEESSLVQGLMLPKKRIDSEMPNFCIIYHKDELQNKFLTGPVKMNNTFVKVIELKSMFNANLFQFSLRL